MSVRHVAASYAGPVVAVAEFERVVTTWDLARGQRLATFETVLSFDGTRLAIDPSGRLCAAAAYERQGLACYDAATGAVVWARRDIKRLQFIAFSRDGERLYCASEARACEVVGATTGQTLASLRGVRRIWESPWADVVFADKANPALATADGGRLAIVSRTTSAFLDVAFGPDTLCISESAGPVRCLDLKGNERWRYVPEAGNHVVRLAYAAADDRYVGVEWPFEHGGDMTLLRFDNPDQGPRRVTTFVAAAATAFWSSGSRLITGDGLEINVTSGTVTRVLAFAGHTSPGTTT